MIFLFNFTKIKTILETKHQRTPVYQLSFPQSYEQRAFFVLRDLRPEEVKDEHPIKPNESISDRINIVEEMVDFFSLLYPF